MKQIIGVILILLLALQVEGLSTIIHPIQYQQSFPLQQASIENGLGDPGEKILKAVRIASQQTDLSEPFLLSLMYSESSFKHKAISSKQYKGLMQIPQSVFYEDANCLIGARIFLEKLRITDGDYRKALILYKGWSLNHPEGKRQADKVLLLARKLNGGLL